MLERSLIEVVTPPLAKLIVPVATVRSELGVDSSNDTKITRLLAAVGREFAGMNGLQRPFLRSTFLERTNGGGGPLLLLRRWPVESITSVTVGVTDPETIDSADYAIRGENRAYLWRDDGWSAAPDCAPASSIAFGGELFTYAVTYVAGWLPLGDGPGLLATWSTATVKVAGQWVKPLAAANGAIALLYECTTAGTTHAATEPTWPTTAGGTVSDGTAVWTARAASELPEDIQEAAIVTAIQWWNGMLTTPIGIQSEAADGFEVSYDFVGARTGFALPPFAMQVLRSYR